MQLRERLVATGEYRTTVVWKPNKSVLVEKDAGGRGHRRESGHTGEQALVEQVARSAGK